MKQTRIAVALAVALFVPLVHAGPIEVKVMTQNLYFGADLGPLVAAPDVPALIGQVTAAYGDVVASNPAERMERIASEILAAKPHIVGLQEAVMWRTRTPSVLTPLPGPEVVAFDFTQMLLTALGPTYSLAIQTTGGFDESAPALLGGILSDIRLTDREAILVRNDLPESEFKVLGTGGATFATSFSVPIGGGAGTVENFRTYAFVDVEMSGLTFRVASTHLEPTVAPVRIAQGLEFIAALNASPYRQIAIGDFNSPADGAGTPAYLNMLGAGFNDTWLEQGIGAGLTCCQAENLLNDPSLFDQRIDFVFHRGGFNTLGVDIIGEDATDQTASSRWPSDHAGVLAVLQVVPAPGTIVLLVIALGALTATRYRWIQRAAARAKGGRPPPRTPARLVDLFQAA